MSAPMHLCLALLTTIIVSVKGSGRLPVAFCTPENSQCKLASDGSADTCFTARSLQQNFYFAIFSTLGESVSVDRLLLKVGSAGTSYNVSLVSGSEAHGLKCSPVPTDSRTLVCPASLANVTSLMVRSEPLPTRLRLLEAAAFQSDGARVNFTDCVAPEAGGQCRRAMDNLAAADSPAVVSEPAQFPSWVGGLNGMEPIGSVKIYRPIENGTTPKTFFRVHATEDCIQVGQSTEQADTVEVLEFQCSGKRAGLLRVWEINADFLISLCEIEVFGDN